MSILDKIMAERRQDSFRREREVPASMLQSSRYLQRPVISLASALKTSSKPLGVIAEHKRASPSEGDYGCPASLEETVSAYRTAGAVAISVLTEPRYFGGSLDHLRVARTLVDLPLLRKDFVATPYQLLEARAAGADAVLLIAAGLSLSTAKELAQRAKDLGLEILLELHGPEELDYLTLEPDVVGVNNRNLKDLSIDLNSSFRLAEQLPASMVRISESGIKNAADAVSLIKAGYPGALIGTQFMKQPNPGNALSEFLADVNKELC